MWTLETSLSYSLWCHSVSWVAGSQCTCGFIFMQIFTRWCTCFCSIDHDSNSGFYHEHIYKKLSSWPFLTTSFRSNDRDQVYMCFYVGSTRTICLWQIVHTHQGHLFFINIVHVYIESKNLNSPFSLNLGYKIISA